MTDGAVRWMTPEEDYARWFNALTPVERLFGEDEARLWFEQRALSLVITEDYKVRSVTAGDTVVHGFQT